MHYRLTALLVALVLATPVVSFAASEGDLITSPSHTAVYKVENGKRRPFANQTVYMTWYTSFSAVKKISVAEVESLELGTPMPVKANTKLIKFPLNPRIYGVVENDTLRHIPDAATAVALFGNAWESKIVELPEIYYLFYNKGAAFDKVLFTPVTSPVNSASSAAIKKILNTNCGQGSEFTDLVGGYRLCYPRTGVFTGSGNAVKFSRVKTGEPMGEVKIITGFNSIAEYVKTKDNAPAIIVQENNLGVERALFEHTVGGWSGHVAIFQNKKTKEIIELTYAFGDKSAEGFLYESTRTFRFLDDAANGQPQYLAASTLTACANYSEATLLARNFVSKNGAEQTEKYQFCYPKNWELSIVGSSQSIDIKAGAATGHISMDTVQSGFDRVAQLKADAQITKLEVITTSGGATVAVYQAAQPDGTFTYIELIQAMPWSGSNSARLTISMKGAMASIPNFADLKKYVTSGFAFNN